jgi:hypothetical protein
MKTTAIPRPPFSPDIAPCAFYLFPKIKLKLKRQRSESIEEIQVKLRNTNFGNFRVAPRKRQR